MRILVIYDSLYGNTEKIAQAIASNLSAKAVSVLKVQINDLRDLHVLIIGSPTQGGRMTVKLQEFLEKIPAGLINNMKVAAFDTRFNELDVNFALRMLMKTIGYAAPKIADSLIKKGGNLIAPAEGFMVTGNEGPLAKNELERAGNWAMNLLTKQLF